MKERKKMLVLPIKKKWFDMIKSGEKKEEYREIKSYWTKRFSKVFGRSTYSCKRNMFVVDNSYPDKILGFMEPQYILFRNGYGNDKPTIKCLVDIVVGYGRPDWGAERNKEYYVLKILSVEKVQNE